MKTILVIEDDVDTCEALKCYLGWNLKTANIKTAANFEIALELFTGGLIADLIIADWRMPGMGAADFFKTVENLFRGAVPITVIYGPLKNSRFIHKLKK